MCSKNQYDIRYSSPSCNVTLLTDTALANLGPQKTDSVVFLLLYKSLLAI